MVQIYTLFPNPPNNRLIIFHFAVHLYPFGVHGVMDSFVLLGLLPYLCGGVFVYSLLFIVYGLQFIVYRG